MYLQNDRHTHTPLVPPKGTCLLDWYFEKGHVSRENMQILKRITKYIFILKPLDVVKKPSFID